MKKLYFLLSIFITSLGFSQTTGDLAFIGFNADGDDNFAIVALADIPANTTIYLSDDELDGSGGFADSNEGNIQWDTPASVITAGTVIIFTDTDSGTNPNFGVSEGTVTYVGSGTVNLSGNGDALFAYLGTDQDNPTTFLAGIQNEANNFGNLTGSGLTEGTTFVTFTTSGNPDGGEYSGPRDSETSFANYLALIGNPANWSIENSDGTLLLPFDTTGFIEAATATPTITVGSGISGLDYFEGNGPSNEDSFTVSGTNLTDDITVNVPVEFGVSLTNGGPYTSSVVLTQSSGSVAPTDVFVILLDGLSANSYTGDATASSTGATDKTVSLEGVVTPADPLINTTGSISDLEYTEGNGPSADDSFSVSALFLGANLVVTAPTNFEVSLTTGAGFADFVTLTPNPSGTVNSTEIFVRLKANLAVGDYSGDVVASSTGATDRTEAANGSVTPAATCSNVGDIIITEVMQNPSASGDDPAGEYIELHNTTGTTINIQGWVIKDDATANETHTISASLEIIGGGYIVIGNASTTAPVLDYNYGNDISLGNGDDGVILECSGTIIDEVIWDNGSTFPDPNGASMELSVTSLNATDNDDGANWGVATSNLGNGDLGTPGAANDFSLSANTFETTNFSLYPNPTNTGIVTISSKINDAINVQVYDILGKQVKNEILINNTLNVSDLKSGIYIVKITQNNTSTTKKLVIK